MWTTVKWLTGSYLLLSLASFACLGLPWVQRLLALAWILTVVRISVKARANQTRLLGLVGIVCAIQLPGILFILVSGWFGLSGHASEWPGGLMEVWYHPFMSTLELLPPMRLGNWSIMYLATGLIPLGTVALCGMTWVMARRLELSKSRF